ncbi:MAG: DUF4382 domain-containing protein [bacterium]|nr:DUF4382 domain-containing protein [bacterium]
MLLPAFERLLPRGATFLAVALLALSLGCADGGGGSSSTSTAAAVGGEGAVAILLTDAPADPSLFSEINLTVVRMELRGEDGAREVLYEGDGQPIDLLELRTHSLPLGLHRTVPAGRYCRLRLEVARIELVFTNGERVDAERPGNSGRIEVVPGGCIEIEDGELAYLQLDIDAGRSIHIVEAPPGSERFLFRPVIHADLVSAAFEEKVVRVEGTVAEVDAEENEILVCDAVSVAETVELPAQRGCVTARLDEDSAFFDNVESEGRPRALDDLFDEFWVGESVTLVGLVDDTLPAVPVVRVPPGQRPPRGACRIWFLGRPPGLQPRPTSCDVEPEEIPAAAVLIDDAGRPVIDRQGLLTVDAFVVQLGEALRLSGVVDAPPTVDVLPILLDPDQAVSALDPIDVALQSAPPGGNGTRILTTTGAPLALEDVFEGDPLTVDGVLVLDDPDFIRGALVLVDVERAGELLVTGEVVKVLDDGFELDLDVNPCRSGRPLAVTTDENTRALSVTITEEGSETAVTDGVVVGDEASVTGLCDDTGLIANIVLVIDDQRETGTP